MTILKTSFLTIGYHHRNKNTVIQTNLNLLAKPGEMVCLIGPNGSGKSTLLRTLSGLQRPLAGKAIVNDVDIQEISSKERALLMSLVLTERIDIENATVRSIVAMGRHPHTNWWGRINEDTEKLVQKAIAMVHLESKTNQLITELSDGERQRVMIAKAFVQDTPIIILDEPTAHLDLPNRVEIMLLLHRMAHETGKTIIISTHELDMALQAADRVWLMTADRGVEVGVPEDLVLNGKFNEAFKSNNYVFNPTNGNFSMNYKLDKQVSVQGDKMSMYWTLRALARVGYAAVEKTNPAIVIENNCWKVGENEYNSIEKLLSALSHPIHHA
ncbi:MAG: ABC transporter ATP-binding protein [Paludibacter sp.]|nr:ABC transporter ATP-binding protein [Paludibacter sp.]